MADVLGTAVGVISLGIQVTQSWLSYYEAYKSQDAKIDQIHKSIASLRRVLTLLDQALPAAQQRYPRVTVEIENSVRECFGGISKLRTMLDECRSSPKQTNSGLQNKAKRVAEKVSFQFRKETLNDLQATLQGLQGNLNTVILVLQA
jgi:chromosome segregation ATPase